ncbi:MAG: hypothetical protein WKF37_05525 [Bryobacteraceae bacterium]
MNQAWLGDTIELEAGQTWDVRTTLILFRKTNGEGFVTIRTTTSDDRLPADDTRITPKYVALLPTLRGVVDGARIIHVEQTRNAVENYRFIGIHMTASDQVDLNDMIRLWAPGIHTDVSFTPNNIVFDRCIFRGHPLRSTLRAMRLNVRNGVVKNSFFEDFKGQSDAQAISSLNAPGPLLVYNNFLSATGENLLTGGAIPDVPGLVVSDYRVEFNALVKDPAQFMREAWRPAMYVRKGKIVQWGRGFYKALDSGTTGDSRPGFPLTTVNRAGRNPLSAGYVRPIDYICPPEFCVVDNGIRWQLNEVSPAVWQPNTKVLEGDLISYRGAETGARTVTYYAAKDGTTGATPPFLWPMPSFNPQPQTCSSQYCIEDGSTQWQRYNGSSIPWWVNKNLLEFKAVDGAVVRWNFFSGSWTDGQTGWGISFKPENQDPSNGWIARTENIDFSYNVMTDVERPFNWQGKGDYGTGISRNWKFHNNLIYGTRPNRSYAISALEDVNNISFTNNTMLIGTGSSLMAISAGTKRSGMVFTDNIVQRGEYGMKRTGTAEGLASLTAAWDDYRVENNIIEGLLPSLYPSGNFNIPVRQLGFLDIDSGDFRTPGCVQGNCPGLQQFQSLSSTNPLGANPDLVPQIRSLRVTASDRAALFTWELTQPIAHIPCAVEISADRDLSTTIPDLDPAAFVRPDTDRDDQNVMVGQWRMFRAGKNMPLASDTVYWYRMHCGGDLKSGSFRTAAALSGSANAPVERVGDGAATTALAVVEYGTQYSRSSDAISNGVLSQSVQCADVGKCAFSIPGDRGSILYYRFYDLAADGSVLHVHPVAAVVIE